MTKSRVIFFKVKTNQEKLSYIVKTAKKHFYEKNPLLFKVQDEASLRFLDDALWKYPLDSFLPHSIEENDILIISKNASNLSQVANLFNLCPDIPSIDPSFKLIYDFDDLAKSDLSQKRFNFYRSLGYIIESN